MLTSKGMCSAYLKSEHFQTSSDVLCCVAIKRNTEDNVSNTEDNISLASTTVYRLNVRRFAHHTQGVCREIPATLTVGLRNSCIFLPL